jgi:glycosyltransferase involved in cell wall biosynthesis
MKITIFTPTYNRSHTISRLYKSLLDQTQLDFEWLIIDDGSTENKSFVKEFMELYNNEFFVKENGNFNTKTNVERLTPLLENKGLKKDNSYQILGGDITIYPKDYFSPFDNATGMLNKTKNTFAIHWFDKSWVPLSERLRSKITRPFHRIFGNNCFKFFKKQLKGFAV